MTSFFTEKLKGRSVFQDGGKCRSIVKERDISRTGGEVPEKGTAAGNIEN